MSHTNTVIEPAEGLTILTGQNNCGKSAIVAALQIVSGNADGNFMVRHGERECVIKVETDEGHVIEWRRKKGTVSYCLNGRDVHRLKRSVPDDLHQLLRLPTVQAEGGDFDIHFAEQKSPIFLLNESAGRRATFFASSSDSVKLIEMQRAHSRRIQEAKSRDLDLTDREAQLSSRLEALSLDGAEERLSALEDSYHSLLQSTQTIATLRGLKREIINATETFGSWLAKANALETLALPPPMVDTSGLRETIGSIHSTHSQITLNDALQTACKSLSAPPQLADTSAPSSAIREINDKRNWIQAVTSQKSVLEALSLPPELAETNRLTAAIRQLDAAEVECTAKRGLSEALRALRGSTGNRRGGRASAANRDARASSPFGSWQTRAMHALSEPNCATAVD